MIWFKFNFSHQLKLNLLSMNLCKLQKRLLLLYEFFEAFMILFLHVYHVKAVP